MGLNVEASSNKFPISLEEADTCSNTSDNRTRVHFISLRTVCFVVVGHRDNISDCPLHYCTWRRAPDFQKEKPQRIFIKRLLQFIIPS